MHVQYMQSQFIEHPFIQKNPQDTVVYNILRNMSF